LTEIAVNYSQTCSVLVQTAEMRETDRQTDRQTDTVSGRNTQQQAQTATCNTTLIIQWAFACIGNNAIQ